MAASFLRVGRAVAFKWVSLETLGLRGAAPSASLCTKVVEPKKSGKKKAAALSVENPAEPEFDISTYKNLQHHNYTTYTFADCDTEMTKYRLPQPSSGRPSPRH
ncbi:NADH dehydrogenase [ubiquinone] flavoprotein 3, mitochondrial isoform X2 [Acipenser ruthenus]|uniref:NADH dehydrogenase [ubiquinone] flavoprotein 3, mitochondrial isoform X2 n=1 Tax=Acipenser ruthenus TaxID=7906 RepID=UPI0027409C19|nr:NADH dehydrogenase [ubiquinone] flavoprotein 3, mitochondrial isoform X2 [Acipenser ruthenus]